MPGNTDLNELTIEQLVFLVQVRGQALEAHRAADDKLFEIMQGDELTGEQVNGFMKAKSNIFAHQMVVEEQILAGYRTPPAAN